MGGVHTRRPGGLRFTSGGRAGILPVVLVVSALVATCGGPAPSAPTSIVQPASPAATNPAATPGVTPLPTPTPDPTKWASLDLPPLVQVATLRATRAVAAGVLPETSFRLASLNGADPVALASRLTVDPPLDLRVTRTDGKTAVIRPATPLRPGQGYRIILRGVDGLLQGAWAVQAVQPLHIPTTIPGDGSTRVPRDTGIEIIFDQEGVSLAEAKPFISIDPAVAGSFVQEGRSVAFAPDKPLKAATLYRVTVRHGLPLHGTNMTLESDRTFAFETAGGTISSTRVMFSRNLEETAPGVAPVFTVRVDRNEDTETGPRPRTVAVTVHRLADIKAAIGAWSAIESAPDWVEVSGSAPVATSGLTRVAKATVRLQAFTPDTDWVRWFRLPAKLPVGWYLVTMTYRGVPRQAVVQVTPVAAYALITQTRSVLWVNSVATKRPIRGATASLLGTTIGRTDASGLLVGKTPGAMLKPSSGQERAVVIVHAGSQSVFVPVGQAACGKCDTGWRGVTEGRWWTLFQQDRYRYRSTDTLNVWGVARERASKNPAGKVEIQLLAADGAAGHAIATRTVKPDASGAFLAKIAFVDLPYGEYRLVMRVGGTQLAERTVEIGPILKPSWTLGLSTNTHAIVVGAPVEVRAKAAFFEGTPVAGARISLGVENDEDGSSGSGQVVPTDSMGTGSQTMHPTRVDDASQWQVVGITGRPEQPEEGEISAWTGVAVFRATVLVQVAPTLKGTRLTLKGSVNDVAFSRFERDGIDNLEQVDPFGAGVAGGSVRLHVVESYSVRHRAGSTYDFVTKRVVPNYTYEVKTKDLGTRTVTTNAKGEYRLTMPVTGGERAYEVTATTKDAAGRETRQETWANENAPYEPSPWAGLDAPGNTESYGIGDAIRIRFSGGARQTSSSRYLWTVSQAGLRTWRITSAPRLTLPFRASFVPGITANAVRFTGTGYEVARNDFSALYRAADKRLDVTVTPDRARYAPGGTATVAIRTTRRDGHPVPASVFIRVIDEKLYAMGIAADEDPLGELYGFVDSGVIGVGWTHEIPQVPSDGDGGDTTGGPGDVRGDFRDWLVATMVHTDPDGRASVTFDLSDDLTSWRATVSGITSSLLAGTGSATLAVGLPFFAEATVAPEYLVADEPVIRLRGYGGALGAADVVTFKVSSDTLPMAATTVQATAFQPAEIRLPKLTLGSHRILVEASAGAGSNIQRDALTRTFTVVTSRTVQSATTMAPLSGPTSVSVGDGFTTLLLSDAGRGRVVPTLQELSWATPLRADETLAAALAGRVLRDEFGLDEADREAQQGDLSRFQADSGISVVPYASPDLELSALAALAGDARINNGALGSWFRDLTETTRERQLWVLVGRAALGQAVVADIEAAAGLKDLTVSEQVVLSLAALAAGDDALAGKLERGVLNAHGQRLGPWVRVTAASPNEETLLTARLAIVAASLGDAVAADMDAFVAANPPKTGVVDLERALAARGWTERVAPADASAVLTTDGKRTTLRIDRSQPVSVVLTPAQARSAQLEPGSGSVLVTTRTEHPLDPSSLTAPEGQRFTRSIQPGTALDATDVVIVEFTVTVGGHGSPGCWQVTDFAPSGLVPIPGGDGVVDQNTGAQIAWAPNRIVGQRVEFCVDEDPLEPTKVLRYAARVITPGTYTWETSVLQSPLVPEQGSVIEPQTITIRGLP